MRRAFRHMIVLALVVATASGPGRIVQACEECDSILIGVYNSLQWRSEAEQEQAVSDFLETSTYAEARKMVQAGVSVTGFGGANFGQEEYRQARARLQSDVRRQGSARSRMDVVERWASPAVAEAWKNAYIARHGTGLQAHLDGADLDLPVLRVSWIPSSGDNQLPRVRGMSIEGGSIVPGVEWKPGQELHTGPTNLVAIKRDPTRPLRVTLDTSKGGVSCHLPPRICAGCQGMGSIPCAECQGTGYVAGPHGPEFLREPCERCRGTQKVACRSCAGRPRVPVPSH